ncbi:hypothetical protein LTR84_012747 [Exophiala bonariae]|uniref:glucan endo-1,3-beta-D-glucosidase n=1 Tax=Exophiala bonariae TaxID=1690606 RepID=A0AAV9NIM1_9EURO|nr:hypothetical protein LTR84_012747 [Exophiala bonariae]
MKYSWSAGALLAAASSVAVHAVTFEAGNYYADQVQAIAYSNFGTAGSYKKVTTMSNGVCNFGDQPYSGGLAPFDKEISWHFRGPLKLKQFASYSPGSGSSKRSLHPSPHERRHAHQHLHQQVHEARDTQDDIIEEKRGLGDWVTATINGDVVSWKNEYAGGAAPAAATPAPVPASGSVPPASPAGSYSAPAPAASVNTGSGTWGRQAYYNAEQGVADGLVFLNNMGGQGSGVFDMTWGNSLAYAGANAKSGSASPVTLADTLIDDNNEVIIFTDKPCNGDCGAVRDGTVAYHGFSGASKLFLMEFSMPLSGKTGFNADMPAAWILNAEVPRTMQYGDCSCWQSGCGEMDVFEVLNSGNTKAISAWHGLNSKGDSNWFQRPIDKTMKAVVVLDGSSGTVHIVVLPDSTNFDTSLTDSAVTGFINSVTDPKLNIKVALP